jgi:hypothetical protein
MADVFQQWLQLRDLAVSHLPRYGNFSALYAMRDRTRTEVLKYGSTRCLRVRILGNYLGGVGGSTTQRIHGELFEKGMIDRVEISWFETQDVVEAKLKESEFRRAFKAVHGRRPAWDLLD